MKQIITFFTQTPRNTFYPLTLTRPVYDLRLGIDTLGEKWMMELHADQNPAGIQYPDHKDLFPSPLTLPSNSAESFAKSTPKFSAELSKSSAEVRFLWIDPCFLPSPELAVLVSNLSFQSGLMSNGRAIAVCLDGENHQKRVDGGHGFRPDNDPGIQWIDLLANPPANSTAADETDPERTSVLEPIVIEHIWDLLTHNGAQISEDLRRREHRNTGSRATLHRIDPDTDASTRTHPSMSVPFTLFGTHPIYVGEGAVVEPGVTFLTGSGPIYLANGCHIMAGSLLRGPVAIGAGATVKMGAKLYENTSIGPVCKVGGEISGSIFHSYSNKGHDGFVGDSLIGQWCNLGADTNTSNLKNNYGTVKVTHPVTGEKSDSGKQFLGTMMGDHSKTAINAMLNTGTVCGVSCNLLAGTVHPVALRSFRWVTDQENVEYRFEKAAETMRRVMARRNVDVTDAYLGMMRSIFDRAE